MGFGVLDDRHMAFPPGTVKIIDNKNDLEMTAPDQHTHGIKRAGDVILQPQPSDNCNDPLNWARRWRWFMMIILDICSAVTVSLGCMITPGLIVLAEQFDQSVDTVTGVMIGAFTFTTSATTFFTASGANVWGKRPFFLLSMAALLGTCIWAYYTKSFPSLTVMRILQGAAAAPLDTLVTSTIADLFFVHQRGIWFSTWSQLVGSGALASQIISGPIIERFGPLAPFGFCAIAYLLLLPLVFFFVPETAWNGSRPNPDAVPVVEAQGEANINAATTGTVSIQAARNPYLKRLAISSGRISDQSFLKGIVKPIPLIAYPAVLYSSIVFAISFTCLAIQGIVGLTIFSAPPYSLTPAQIGLTIIPLLLTHFFTSPVGGIASDKLVKYLARRNSGILEPEFRLLLMVMFVPAAAASAFGTGYAVRNHAPLSVLITLQSLQAFACPFAAQTSMTYVVDCHPCDQNQAFVTIGLFRSGLMFFATAKATGWYMKLGPVTLFNSIAGVILAAGMLTVAAYIYGKRFRSKVARSTLAQKLS